MSEQKLYPDIRIGKWAKVCQRIAIVGLGYSLLVTVGFRSVESQAQLGFFLFYILPAIFILIPLELVVLLITLQSWNRWRRPEQRLITLLGSSGALTLLISQLVFDVGAS